MFMRRDILNREQEIRQWVNERVTKAEISRRLKCKPITLDNYLKKFGIDYHGKQGWLAGLTYNSRKYVPFEEYIKRTSHISSDKLRRKIFREGIKQKKCECCGRFEWMGQQIPLEVHHKDGDKTNNNLDNLQILCPNCHALTPTYRGKNAKLA